MKPDLRNAAVALVLALSACSGPGPVTPLNLPPDIARACAVTERKCTACHERERWLEARHSPEEWRDIVDEMRLLPGSGITLRDSEEAVRCLNYRSPKPVAALRPSPAPMVAGVSLFVPR